MDNHRWDMTELFYELRRKSIIIANVPTKTECFVNVTRTESSNKLGGLLNTLKIFTGQHTLILPTAISTIPGVVKKHH